MADITRLARSFSEQYLPSVLRAEALKKIEWHKAQGDEVYVVSASLDFYLSCWCRSQGINWVCSELETKNNKLTGRYVSGDCSLENKVSAIKRKVNLSDFKTIYAYGDTTEDMPMLALAHEKYFNWQRVYWPRCSLMSCNMRTLYLLVFDKLFIVSNIIKTYFVHIQQKRK